MVVSLILCGLLASADAPSVLTLQQALHTAHQQQPSLRAVQATERAKNAAVGSAFAGFLPRLDGNFDYKRSTGNFELNPSFAKGNFLQLVTDPQTGKVDLGSTWSTVNYLTGDATLRVTLWDFGKTLGNYDGAAADHDASISDVQASEIDVALQVRTAFYEALANKALVQVATDTVQNQQKHVDEISHMVAAGTRPKIDLSASQVDLDNTELTLVRNQNAFDVARVKLNQAMGVEGAIDYDLTVPEDLPLAAETQGVDTVIDEALKQRPEFAKILAQLTQAEAAKHVAMAGYFPAITGTSRINVSKIDNLPWGWNWYVGAGLTWNFFAGTLTYHQVEEAEARMASLTANRDAIRQQVRAQLMQQLLAVSEAKRRVDVTGHAASTSDDKLSLAEGRYKAGISTVLELGDAQISRANAHAQQVQAQYDLSTARARLLHAMGKSA